MHRPQDLNTASSLALLQEDATQDVPIKRFESSKKHSSELVKCSGESSKSNYKYGEDQKHNNSTLPKSTDDNKTALKNFRRAKGLCFKCGEKWNPQHKCPPSVSFHAMEQLWKCVTEGEDLQFLSVEQDSESEEDLMALSVQALNGTEGSKTIRLRGYLQDREVFILLDSGSSHSFISDQIVTNLTSAQPLTHPVHIKVANG